MLSKAFPGFPFDVNKLSATRNPGRGSGLPLEWMLVAALFLVCAIVSFSVTAEDAYISFRYAENMAGGFGPAFNRYGPPVEGYSNPLWVAILSNADIVGINVVWAGRVLGILFGILALLEIMRTVRLAGSGDNRGPLLAAVAVATMPAFLFWAQVGLENALYLWLLILSVRLSIEENREPHRFPYSAISLILLALTRPEGITFFVLILVWRIWTSFSDRRPVFNKSTLLWIALVVAIYGIFLLNRYWTFGMWLPNTFYAKVNNGTLFKLKTGAFYLLRAMNHSLWVPLLAPAILVPLSWKSRSSDSTGILKLLFLVAIGQILFILYVGGDIHPNDRAALLLFVVSSLSCFVALVGLSEKGIRERILVYVTILMIAANLLYTFPPSPQITPPMRRPPNFLSANLGNLLTGQTTLKHVFDRFIMPPPEGFELVGKDLARNCAPDVLLAADQCGMIPYYSKLNTIDLLGLNNVDIARTVHSTSKWGEYAELVLDQRPDIFIVAYRNGRLVSQYYLTNTVLSEPFRNRYELDAIYHIDYSFLDIAGLKHSFGFEFLRFRLKPDGLNAPLTEAEKQWLDTHEPLSENAGTLSAMVEHFRQNNRFDPTRIIRFDVSLN